MQASLPEVALSIDTYDSVNAICELAGRWEILPSAYKHGPPIAVLVLLRSTSLPSKPNHLAACLGLTERLPGLHELPALVE